MVLVGTAFGMARRRMRRGNDPLAPNSNPQNMNFQRNPLTSTRNIRPTPTTALQLLQHERIQIQPTVVRQTFKRAPTNQMVASPTIQSVNPILQHARQHQMRPISGMDPRKDLQVFQATTVRNIRQGRTNARVTGMRKDHVMI